MQTHAQVRADGQAARTHARKTDFSARKPPFSLLAPLLHVIAGPVTLIAGFLIWGSSLLRRSRWAYEVVRSWCRVLHFMTGVGHFLRGAENIPEGPFVIIANHSSHLDGPGLIVTLTEPLSFVIKRELTRIPVWGPAVVRIGFIGIDRSDSEAARKTLRRAEQTVRAGRRVIFFAEGTRAPDHRLHPFKKGGFHLAVGAQVPILPVAINGSRRLFPKNSFLPRGGEIEFVVGRPIATEGLGVDDIPTLMCETRRVILEGRRRDPDFVDNEGRATA